MKTLLLFIFLFADVKCENSPVESSSTTVYVCGSGKAKKYHYDAKCRGLGNCQYKIVKIALEKATAEGKTLCGWED